MADFRLLKNGGVRRILDGAQIPDSISNRDWIEYIKWRDSGNTADPVEPDPPPTQDELNLIAVKADAETQILANMTPAQGIAAVNAISNLAEAKVVLRRMVAAFIVLVKRL